MQALILAAGMGRRMGKHTEHHTKCMVKVAGRTLLERAVEALKLAGIHKLVMVVGYEADKLKGYIEEMNFGMEVEYVYNTDYANTNNIYSLYLAKEQLKKEDTILLESDLIFDPEIIPQVVKAEQKNMVVVARYEQWMDGTVAVLDNKGKVADFIDKEHFHYADAEQYYKTVNIYKFSKEFSASQYIPFLEAYISAYGKNLYYEQVLKIFAHIRNSELDTFILKNEKWYELDDAQDLDIADTLFADSSNILEKYEMHFGGYWRFPKVKDFCYLVNPYYPPEKMVNQMTYFWKELLLQYPSGMDIQKLNAGSMFDIDEDFLLVGNGAAELINVLGKILKGRLSVCIPTFNEYVRCFTSCEIREIYSEAHGYGYDLNRLLEEVDHTDHLLLINPDNPTGSMLDYDQVLELLDKCEAKGVTLVFDESFIDFAEKDRRYTLVREDILKKYSCLLVIKSISKSYGVPGLRLGIIAGSDQDMLNEIRKNMAIWNINSFAEYYLQIQRLYKKDYQKACDMLAEQRAYLEGELKKISGIIVYPSQANYIMCEIVEQMTSEHLATVLMEDYNILIKNLSEKKGFQSRSFFRVAVKNREDNELLIAAMRGILERRNNI